MNETVEGSKEIWGNESLLMRDQNRRNGGIGLMNLVNLYRPPLEKKKSKPNRHVIWKERQNPVRKTGEVYRADIWRDDTIPPFDKIMV